MIVKDMKDYQGMDLAFYRGVVMFFINFYKLSFGVKNKLKNNLLNKSINWQYATFMNICSISVGNYLFLRILDDQF